MANPEHLKILLEYGVVAFNEWRMENPELTPDLSGADFSRLDLSNVNFENANLSEVFFEFTRLSFSNLKNVNISLANISQANFFECNLEKVNFSPAFLTKAHFARTILKNTNFEGLSLQNLNFHRANFDGSNLKNCRFDSSNLRLANFENADLTGASLHRTALRGAQFKNARIHGVDLSFSRQLPQKEINHALGDSETILLKRMKRPAHWLEDNAPKVIQITAPVRFIETPNKVDVDNPVQPATEHTEAFKKGTFKAFKALSHDFAIHLEDCNVSNDTKKRAKAFAVTVNVAFDEFEVILVASKFRSLTRLIKGEFEAITDGLQVDFGEWETNFSVLEDMYPEARQYRKNSQTVKMPDEGIPKELEAIIIEALASKEALELLTPKAQEKMKELEEEAASNDPDTVKERALGIVTSFTNLMRILENIMNRTKTGLDKAHKLADKARVIHTKAAPIIKWANELLKIFDNQG